MGRTGKKQFHVEQQKGTPQIPHIAEQNWGVIRRKLNRAETHGQLQRQENTHKHKYHTDKNEKHIQTKKLMTTRPMLNIWLNQEYT